MIRRFSIALLLLALFLELKVQVSDAATVESCTGSFAGTVTHGSDLGLALSGNITLAVSDKGDVTGVLVENDNSSVNVTGEFHNRIIRLKFELGDATIQGVGQLPGGFTPCTSNFGGHFTGPNPSDIGDWGIIWGS